MDPSARVTMKDAAKCDKRREWQNSVNQENAERILHFHCDDVHAAATHLFTVAILAQGKHSG